MKKKAIVAVVALVLVLCCAMGGTLAWLVDSTTEVKNTFTYGDINISLWEHKLNNDGLTLSDEGFTGAEQTGFKMIPGNTIDKDPTVTVKANSEASWLFVKVEKSNNFDSFMKYAVDSDWTLLDTRDDGLTSVYYYNGTDLNALLKEDKSFNILGTGSYDNYTWQENEVFVLPTVKKDDLKGLTDETLPTLKFTAYAVQRDTNITTAVQAWDIAKGNN